MDIIKSWIELDIKLVAIVNDKHVHTFNTTIILQVSMVHPQHKAVESH